MIFIEEFIKNNFKPIKYGNKVVYCWYVIELPKNSRINLEFISKNSSYAQAVSMSFSSGEINVNNRKYLAKGKRGVGFRFWFEDRNEQELIIKNGSTVKIWNAWDDGYIKSLMSGAGLIVENINDRELLFYANDGAIDDDFDDLIFKIIITDENGHNSLPYKL